MGDIGAGIVLYNPSIERLKDNLNSIVCQVQFVCVVDNASSNIAEIESLLENYGNSILLIKNEKNKGIAKALNQIFNNASLKKIEWVITLDQDSVCSKNMIKSLAQYRGRGVGIICPLIIDRSIGALDSDLSVKKEIEYIDFCITSASLTSVSAWNLVGGFDENMFIDGVDADFCYALRQKKLKIIRNNTTSMIHELGHNSKEVLLLGHRQVVFNHSPQRYYYISRNNIYLCKKYPDILPSVIRGTLTIIYRIFLIVIFENQKMQKTISSIKGLLDGYKMSVK